MNRTKRRGKTTLALLAAVATAPALLAQNTPPPPAPTHQAAPQPDAAAPGNAFPEAQSQAAAKQATAPQADQSDPPSAKSGDNSFPQAESEAAAKKAESEAGGGSALPPGTTAPDDDPNSSSSRTRFKGMDLLGNGDSPVSDGAGHFVADPKLGERDVKIGQLYMASGNYLGAYSRFKEATEVAPLNTDALFYLAEAARKTSHLDEAESNYKLYISVDPKGKKAKEAKKALTELAGK